ncbi:MAG: hypothetical protein IT343_00155 [Candidatus Melainabacteria bacterium]|nr:hypothetical protein [Candidatus Melainabacteria bacterium]
MRSGHLSIALCCLLALSVGAGNCEDTTSKQTADKAADKAAGPTACSDAPTADRRMARLSWTGCIEAFFDSSPVD